MSLAKFRSLHTPCRTFLHQSYPLIQLRHYNTKPSNCIRNQLCWKQTNLLNAEPHFFMKAPMRMCSSHNIVRPGKVSPTRHIPEHIVKPQYDNLNSWSITNFFKRSPKPEIKTSDQIYKMRDACYLARQILTDAGKLAKAGTTTDEIDAFVHEESIRNNAYPSPLLYKKFPKSVCTSVNNVACHGIPDDRSLMEGDIINIDVTVCIKDQT